jgi:hypothetical protein
VLRAPFHKERSLFRLDNTSMASTFAESLVQLCAAKKPDLEKYMNDVKKECEKEACKGFNTADFYIWSCLSAPSEIKREAAILGLNVLMAEKRGKDVYVKVNWESGQGRKRQREYDQQEPMCKRQKGASAIAQHQGVAFAKRLTQLSSAKKPDLEKYMNDVKKECEKEASKGFNTADFYIWRCLSAPSEIKREAAILGLNVLMAEKRGKDVYMKVKWLKEVPLCQPRHLEKGNVRMDCAICMETETMSLLHPCGHLVGKNCAKKLLDKSNSCPFCRQRMRFIHAVFKP